MCRRWCRYCEVSAALNDQNILSSLVTAALNHRVDELLVQIVTAVRQSSSSRHRRGAAAAESVATPDTGAQHALSAVDISSLPAASQDSADTGCVRSAAIMLKGLFTKQKSPPAAKSRENLID